MKKYIINNKIKNYRFDTGNNSSKILKFGIAEFERFINESVGEIQENGDTETITIFLGDNPLSKKYKEKLLLETKNSSAYQIVSINDHIYINGVTDYAVLYGLYDLLNRLIDLEFYSKDTYTLSYKSDIYFDDLEIFNEPDFEYRHIGFYETANNNVVASRLRVMSNYMSFEDKHPPSPDVISGDIFYDIWGGLWGHTMLKILPIAKDMNNNPINPEWYSSDLKQLCMTNESAKNAFISSLKEHILKYPEAKLFMLGVMDEYTHCNCDHCKISHERYGGPAGTHIRFINDVARSIKQWQQDVLPKSTFLLAAFAYLTYSHAPVKETKNGYTVIDESLIMEDNTAILIAPLDMTSTYSINHAKNQFVKDRFNKWKVINKHLIVWDYHVYFDNYLAYMPNFKYYQENLKFYKESNAFFVYSEGALMDYSPGFHDLKIYLLSKLKWNVHLNIDVLIKNFISAYYKQGAVFIEKYLTRLDNHYENLNTEYLKKGNRGYYSGYETRWQLDYMTTTHWPKELLVELRGLLEQALEAVKGDKVTENHIKTELITIEYLWIELHMPFATKGEILNKVDIFESLIKDVGIKRLTHWGFLPEEEKREHFLKRKIEQYRALYPMCSDERD